MEDIGPNFKACTYLLCTKALAIRFMSCTPLVFLSVRWLPSSMKIKLNTNGSIVNNVIQGGMFS